jgi:hypothetical protein
METKHCPRHNGEWGDENTCDYCTYREDGSPREVTDFDLEISRHELCRLAPELLILFREFVNYGMCRQENAVERKSLAEKFRSLSVEAHKQFPSLKLRHSGAKVVITEESPAHI